MSPEPPVPPTDLPNKVPESINEYSPDQLRCLARYLEDLAVYREQAPCLDEEAEGDETKGPPEDLPEDVPSKATITIKKINENQYYYWQWRDGDKIKSKYKGPVNHTG